ncbi:hypothetical protein [Phaffia rhodozyma]|uniref:Uncharacterized protein n=1 Tax=Phaffia rhodozyma TaxID=264483 RepID=A0A0F7SVP2_PHARH|nr:hypothetical protein [Phaffia rhodozyma]
MDHPPLTPTRITDNLPSTTSTSVCSPTQLINHDHGHDASDTESTTAETASTCSSFAEWSSGSDSDSNPNRIFYGPTRTPERKLLQKVRHKDSREFHRRKTLWEDPSVRAADRSILSPTKSSQCELSVVTSVRSPCSTPPPRNVRRPSPQTRLESPNKYIDNPASSLSTPPASPPHSTTTPSPPTRSPKFPPSPSAVPVCGSPFPTYITSRARTFHHNRRKPSDLAKADESFSSADGSMSADSEDEFEYQPEPESVHQPEAAPHAELDANEEDEGEWETEGEHEEEEEEEEEEEADVPKEEDIDETGCALDQSVESAKQEELEGEREREPEEEFVVAQPTEDCISGDPVEAGTEPIAMIPFDIVTEETAEEHAQDVTEITVEETIPIITPQVASVVTEETIEEIAEDSTMKILQEDFEDISKKTFNETPANLVEESMEQSTELPVEVYTKETITESTEERAEVATSDAQYAMDLESADGSGDKSETDVQKDVRGEESGKVVVNGDSSEFTNRTEVEEVEEDVGNAGGVADEESVVSADHIEPCADENQEISGQGEDEVLRLPPDETRDDLGESNVEKFQPSDQPRLDVLTFSQSEEGSAALLDGVSPVSLCHQTPTSSPKLSPDQLAAHSITPNTSAGLDEPAICERIQPAYTNAQSNVLVVSSLNPKAVLPEPFSEPVRSTPKRVQKSPVKSSHSKRKSSRSQPSSSSTTAAAASQRILSKPSEFALNEAESTRPQEPITSPGPLRQTFPNSVASTFSSGSGSDSTSASTFISIPPVSVLKPLSVSLSLPSATGTASSSPAFSSSRLQGPSRSFGSNAESKVPKRDINVPERSALSKSAFRPTLSNKARGYIPGVSVKSRGGYSSPSKSTILGPPVRVLHSPTTRSSSSTTATFLGSHSIGPLSRSTGSVSPAPGIAPTVLPRVRPLGGTSSGSLGHGLQKDVPSEALTVGLTRKTFDQHRTKDHSAKVEGGAGPGLGNSVRSVSSSLIPTSASASAFTSVPLSSAPSLVSPSTKTTGQDRPSGPASSLRSIPTRRSARAAGEPVGSAAPTIALPPVSHRSRTGFGGGSGGGVLTTSSAGAVHSIASSTIPSLAMKPRRLPHSALNGSTASSSSASLPTVLTPPPPVPPLPSALAAPPAMANPVVPAPPPMLSKDLASLTDHNTIVNGVLFCALTRTVVRREGEHRPSSPGPKKKSPLAMAAASSSSSRSTSGAGTGRGRKVSFGSESEEEEEEEDGAWPGLNGGGSVSDQEKKTHLLGPGEDEVFVSPIRKNRSSATCGRKQLWSGSTSAVEARRSSDRMVKWKKSLVVSNSRSGADRTYQSTEEISAELKKSCIKPTASLDVHGNLDLTKLPPLTSIIKRTKVTYVRFVYDDDLPKAPAGEKKKKRGK